jgi:hypothetical protein
MNTAEQLTSSQRWQRIWHRILQPLLSPAAALPGAERVTAGRKGHRRLKLPARYDEFAHGSGRTFLFNCRF